MASLSEQFLQDVSGAAPSGGASSLSAQFAADIAAGAATKPENKSAPKTINGKNWVVPDPVLMGIGDTIKGGMQSLLHGASWVAHKVAPNAEITKEIDAALPQVDQNITQQERAYQQSRTAAGKGGIDWGRMAGNAVSSAPLLASGPEMQGASLLGKTLVGTGIGVASSGLQPVTDIPDGSSYAKEKAKQMAVSGALGGATAPIAAGMARVVQPKTNANVKALIDQGVTPTPGQILGGAAARTEEKLTSVPVVGDMIKNAQGRAVLDFNKAAINRALEPIGEKLPNGVIGRDAIEYTADKLGAAYEGVLNRIGAVVPDAQFSSDLGSLSSLTKNLPKDGAEQFDRIIQNEIIGRISNGALTSDGLKAAESNLGQIAKSYARSGDYDKRVLGEAIEEAQATLRSLVQRTNPNEAQTLQDINRGYANFLRVQRAASSVKDNGIFTPEQLQGAVKALDSSRNKGAFARGNALMQDLSEPGKSVLGAKYPDSGTAGRSILAAATPLAIAGYSHPLFALGGAALGGAAVAPYTSLGQKLAAALLTKRPAGAEGMANALRSVPPAVGAAFAPALIQSFNN